jgi:outer membrane biosynthesis protein TonB
MTHPVFRSFGVSILIHSLLFGLFLLSQVFGVERIPIFKIVDAAKEFLMPPPPAVTPRTQEISLVFVEVDPSLAVKEAPQDAKFYSAVSTEAANPTIAKESLLKVLEHSRSKAQPLQPNPETEKTADKVEEARSKKKETVGDLALAKPQEKPEKDLGKAESGKGEGAVDTKKPRPRTLSEAKAGSRGEKSKTVGGVPRLDSNSIAARGTILGDYDARFVDAVKQCWYDLLEPRTIMKPGKVVVEFALHHDGRISDVKIVENHCGEMEALFCETAITKPAPFERWPTDLRRELKGDTREVTFTFYYE